MAERKNEIALKQNVGDQVIARVEELNKVGFIMPSDYSYVNAIKASLLKLQDLKDKNGKNALEVCTPNSISTALFLMATKGLDASKNTCYLIVRGNQLCMHESYFGKVLQVKRIYPNFNPSPVVIHEGDDFVYDIDPMTGRKRIVKHVQKLENLDKDFIGAYMYIPTSDGGQDLYIMTKKAIMTAWSKSSSREMSVHKTFSEKMISKTIINSACNMIINSTPSLSYLSDDAPNGNTETEQAPAREAVEDVNFEDAEVVETAAPEVDTETGEVTEQPSEQPEQPEESEF